MCVIVFGCLSLDASYFCPFFYCQVGDANMASYKSNSRGVAVLFNNKFEFKVR